MVKIFITRFNIKHNDVVHLNNFYRAFHDYLYDEEYLNSEKSDIGKDRNEDFPETYYYENRTQRTGKELWIWWRPSKYILMFESRFWRRKIDITLHFRNVKDIEIMHEGKKLKAQVANIDLWVFFYFELDYLKEWDKNPITKAFFEVFWKRIYNKTLDGHKKETMRDAQKLQEYIKNSLRMQLYSPPRKSFVPKQYLPELSGNY